MKGYLKLKTKESDQLVKTKVRQFFKAHGYYELNSSKENRLVFKNYSETSNHLSPLRFDDRININLNNEQVKYTVRDVIGLSSFDKEYFMDLMDNMKEYVETNRLVLVNKEKYEHIAGTVFYNFTKVEAITIIAIAAGIFCLKYFYELSMYEWLFYLFCGLVGLFLKYSFSKRLVQKLEES